MEAGPRGLGASASSGGALPLLLIFKSMVIDVAEVDGVAGNVVVAAALRQLQTLDSESAATIVRLGLSREIVQVALSI